MLAPLKTALRNVQFVVGYGNVWLRTETLGENPKYGKFWNLNQERL